jgi:hypothetical protein
MRASNTIAIRTGDKFVDALGKNLQGANLSESRKFIDKNCFGTPNAELLDRLYRIKPYISESDFKMIERNLESKKWCVSYYSDVCRNVTAAGGEYMYFYVTKECKVNGATRKMLEALKDHFSFEKADGIQVQIILNEIYVLDACMRAAKYGYSWDYIHPKISECGDVKVE